jgi:hypothetical protein
MKQQSIVILALLGKISAYRLVQNQRFIDGTDASYEEDNDSYVSQLGFSEGVGASYHRIDKEVQNMPEPEPVRMTQSFP